MSTWGGDLCSTTSIHCGSQKLLFVISNMKFEITNLYDAQRMLVSLNEHRSHKSYDKFFRWHFVCEIPNVRTKNRKESSAIFHFSLSIFHFLFESNDEMEMK